jgi:hypothetical protein
MQFAREGVGFVHEVENVHAHDAVERVRGDIVRLREVSDEGRVRIVRGQIEDVDPRRSSSPEPPHVPRIVKLQAATTDAVSVGFEKPVYVVSVNGESALVAERSADRPNSAGKKQTAPGHTKPSANNMSHSSRTDHWSMTRCNQSRKSSAGRGGT